MSVFYTLLEVEIRDQKGRNTPRRIRKILNMRPPPMLEKAPGYHNLGVREGRLSQEHVCLMHGVRPLGNVAQSVSRSLDLYLFRLDRGGECGERDRGCSLSFTIL